MHILLHLKNSSIILFSVSLKHVLVFLMKFILPRKYYLSSSGEREIVKINTSWRSWYWYLIPSSFSELKESADSFPCFKRFARRTFVRGRGGEVSFRLIDAREQWARRRQGAEIERLELVRFANEATGYYLHNGGDMRQYPRRMQITDYHKGRYDACTGCS